ncbi:MAG: DUF1847 domain-containing protein [Desulfarculus sp.]|nr:DUF1847 domain-containing protein [Pseudomonadota bacterium]MBV1714753.1 DUF1847 domain-containing protein [Desulfarculus sp.]MBU4575085.1 DUF1847 domain-containing protein [Pseudomonadota bacterium]MBU4600294.1 DUF1847 domain-containing protein [Pseudomonadota bacterium]MBV1740241.1 DUF1847 domain-containing protein [Desulfarculus sp.]
MSKKNNTPQDPACAACKVAIRKRACVTPGGVGGVGCPTQEQAQALEAANAKYDDPQLMEFARQASLQEAACYVNRDQRPYVLQPSKTRIQEIWEFAHRMGYTKVGLAFCLGLVNEAAKVEQMFKSHGLEVVSALCKAGATPKEMLGLGDEDKVRQGGFESVCNPVFQAELMNRAGTQLNVLLGLCVGHDSLFFAHAKAPSTVLAVKDRVTGHNPLAAVYLSDGYYAKLKEADSQGSDELL